MAIISNEVLIRIREEGGDRIQARLDSYMESLKRIGKEDLTKGVQELSSRVENLKRSIITNAAPASELTKEWKGIVKEIEKLSSDIFANPNDLDKARKNLNKYTEELEKNKQKLEELQSQRNKADIWQNINNIGGNYKYNTKESIQSYLNDINEKNGTSYSIDSLQKAQGFLRAMTQERMEELGIDEKIITAIEKMLSLTDKTAQKNREAIPGLQEKITVSEQEVKQEQLKVQELEKQAELDKQLIQDKELLRKDTNSISEGHLIATPTSDFIIDKQNEHKEATNEWAKQNKQVDITVERLINRYLSFYAVLRTIKRIGREVYNTTKELDSAFNQIAIVSNYTTKEVWGMYDSFLAIANITGTTSKEIVKVAGEYFKQGKSLSESLILTEAAAMAARVAGIEATQSVEYLTAALNGYNLSANQAMNVSDKFSKLAAISATDYEDLALALTKVAAQANASGVAMDSLLGFMTTALEVTQEAPENIGTAFKTILARMSQITDYGEVLEDNTTANDVSKALDTIGVKLFNTEGQMRNLDEVLMEVGEQWSSLNTIQQKYITTALAGTRQQTRLIAVFQNWDKTMKYVKASQDSAGASLAQQGKYMESMEYSLSKLNNAWEAFIQNISSSEAIKDIVDLLTTLINTLTPISGLLTTVATGFASIVALGSLKGGGFLSTLFNKIGGSFYKGLESIGGSISSIGSKTNINKISNLGASLTATGNGSAGLAAGLKAIVSSLGELIPWILAIIAVLKTLDLAIETVGEAKKNITEKYSLIYNTEEEINTTKELVEEYKNLNSQLVKTADDYEKLNSLKQQIEENTGEEFNENYSLDDWLKEQNNNIIEAYDSMINSIETLGGLSEAYYGDSADSYTKAAALQIKSIEILTNKLGDAKGAIKEYYNNIDEYSDKAMSDANNMAKALLKLEYSDNGTFGENLKESLKEVWEWIKNIGKDIFSFFTELAKGIANAFGKEINNINLLQFGNKYHSVKELLNDVSDEEIINKEKQIERYKKILLNNPNNTDYGNNIIKEQIDNLVQELDSLKNVDFFGELENFLVSDTLEMLPKEFDLMVEKLKMYPEQLNDFYDSLSIKSGATAAAVRLYSGEIATSAEDATNKVNELANKLNVTTDELGDEISKYESIMAPFIDTTWESTDQMYDFIKAMSSARDNLNNNNFESYIKNLKDAGVKTKDLVNSTFEFADAISGLDTEKIFNEGLSKVTEINNLNSALADGSISISQLYGVLSQYPELQNKIINSIVNTGQISENVANQMIAAKQEEYKQSLKIEAEKYSIIAEVYEEQVKFAEKYKENLINDYLDNNEDYATSLDTNLSNTITSLGNQYSAYNEYFKWLSKSQNEAINGQYTESDFSALKNRIDKTKNPLYKITEEDRKIAKAAVEAQIQEYKNLAKQNRDLSNTYMALYNGIGNGAISAFGKITEATDKSKDSAEEYERALNDIYNAEQRLAAASNKLSLIDALKDLYENRNGLEYKYLLEEQTKALEQQSKAYADLISKQKVEQQSLLNQNSNLSKYVQLVDGRLQVVLNKYIKASDEEAELIDDLVEQYNDLSDNINENTISIIENQSALKELEETRRDMIIETQETLIEAIKEEQKTIYEEQKKGLEKEKELLEKRKKLYQDAFEEEDYQNEIQDLNNKRQNIIEQLNNLSGANDGKSKQKRQELLEELNDLNKEYNDKTTEYNREALVNRIDNDIKANEEEQNKLEELYNETINNYAWLQEQIVQLTSKGVEECLKYLKEWHTDYTEGTEIMKTQVEEKWTALFNSVYGDIDGIELESAKALQNMVDNNATAVNQMIDNYKKLAQAGIDANNNKVTNVPPANVTPIISAASTASVGGGGKRLLMKYSGGGYVRYTGPAWVDGTPSSPEAFLSAKDTANFEALKVALEKSNIDNSINSGDITIEAINIETEHLDNNQDWYNSGLEFGSALQKALHQRGLVANIKR